MARGLLEGQARYPKRARHPFRSLGHIIVTRPRRNVHHQRNRPPCRRGAARVSTLHLPRGTLWRPLRRPLRCVYPRTSRAARATSPNKSQGPRFDRPRGVQLFEHLGPLLPPLVWAWALCEANRRIHVGYYHEGGETALRVPNLHAPAPYHGPHPECAELLQKVPCGKP